MFWSKAMTDRLESLWKDGVPISDIGRKLSIEFDTVITRNAAVGKAMRMGFIDRYPRGTPANLNGTSVSPAYKRPAQTAAKPSPRVIDLAPARMAESEATRCRWLDGQVIGRQGNKLERAANVAKYRKDLTHWKAPTDTTPVYACWADVPRCPNERVENKSYCAVHCRICYQDPKGEAVDGSE